MRRLLAAALLSTLLAVAGYAQTFRGAINGSVTDPSGAVVANAKVTATNVGTSVVLNTVTTSNGEYSFQDLPLGTYKVTVSAGGFSQVTVDQVSVTAGSIYTLPVQLKMGQQTTAIEVSAAALSIDTTATTQSNTIPDVVVQNIPLNGRDYTQLIAATPGYGGYAADGTGQYNGTRINQMNWQIDGVDNNDFWHNIPAVNQGGVSGIAGVILPLDAIDEFSAQSQSQAESGRNPGAVVNLVLKAGTNGLHGSVYYFNRNEFYGASSPFKPANQKQPPLRNQNYGFSFGGPIIKDKTFFFTAFEKQQYIIGLSGLATEPSAQWVAKAGAQLSAAGVLVSPLSCNLLGALTSLLASPCPGSGLWPTSGAGSITGLPATLKNFFSPVASTGYSYNGVIKLDHNFTEKHHLSARWFGGQGSQTAPLGASPALGTASSNLSFYFEKAPIHVYNYAVTFNSVLTPRMTNQILFGVNYFNQVFNDANHSFDTRALGLNLSPDATINGKPIFGAPNITIDAGGGSGFEQIGITPPEGRNDITGMLADIVSYNVGKHQVRFGGEVRQARVNEFYFKRSLGSFAFDGTQGPWPVCAPTDQICLTTNALSDFLAGDVSTSSIAVGDAERKVRVNGFNFFGQDSWQVTRKLNFNLGLRYEYYGTPHNSSKDLAVFIPGRGLQIQGNGIDSLFPPDRNNFAPRFGFAYQPKENGDMVFRGGIGVFYDQINMNPFFDYRPAITAADGIQDNPIGPHAVSNYSLNAYNWDAVQSGGKSIFPGVTLCPTLAGCANTYNVFSVNQNFRAPYFFNYNFNMEKGLGRAAVWQIGYVGSQGRKLLVNLNINQFGQFAAANPNAGSIIQPNSIGTSNYNSLQTTLKIRSWHGFTSQLSYTWAHALDVGTEYRSVFPLDSTNLKEEYGNSDFDQRHSLSVFWNYDVPGAKWGPKFLTHGWQVSSLIQVHSGNPFNLLLSGNPLNVNGGGGESRPGENLVGDPFAGVSHSFVKSTSLTGVQWVNPAAFCVAGAAGCAGPTDPHGDLARNKFYAPGYGDWDLSVFKNIAVTERFKIQLRAEMYNVFNRINLPSGPFSVNSNGTVTDTIGDFNGAPGIGAGEPFNMQLAAKILF
jgi:hypothetical protein